LFVSLFDSLLPPKDMNQSEKLQHQFFRRNFPEKEKGKKKMKFFLQINLQFTKYKVSKKTFCSMIFFAICETVWQEQKPIVVAFVAISLE
jgi:hypothetical protein